MDNFLYINACKTTLSEGITPSQTTIEVTNPARFPSSIPAGRVLVLTIHPDGLPSTQEIVHCAAISGATLTIARGAQSTTAASWPEGSVVGAYLTAEMLAQIAADVNGHAGSGGSAHALVTTVAAGFMSAADKTKLNGVQSGATAYVHPVTHSPTVIAQNTSNRFVTDAEKANWNAAKNHADSAHAPSNAQKNSDITKAEIEAKLTGAVASHTHLYAGSATAGGAASAATKLATARAIALTGDVSGSVSFDGSANVSMSTTVANDSHTHSGYAATSHTHSDYITKDMTHGAIGSLCFAIHTTSSVINPGTEVAGSILRPSSTHNNSGPSLLGTWKCLGVGDYDDGSRFATLYQRIA